AAATTTALTLAVAILSGPSLLAQHGTGGAISGDSIQSSYYARTELERKLQHDIVCTCGSCGHASIGECRQDPCGVSHKLRGEVATLIDEGKSHDEVIQAIVKMYGSEEMLGAPLDTGFNRLAWLFPYLIGATGAVGVGLVAMRWSHQRAAEVP